MSAEERQERHQRTRERAVGIRRCEATVMRGVPAGPAVCDHPLDERGECSEASDHIDD